MRTGISLKIQLGAEIIIGFCLIMVFHYLITGIASLYHIDGLWIGVLTYLGTGLAIVLYVIKADKRSLAYLGLLRPVLIDLPNGILLGLVMFLAQQIPLIIMGMDYSVLAAEPDWGRIAIMSVYCFVCVGFTEELVFRGFILQKSLELCRSKSMAFVMNCLLFYAVHWPPVRFVFGEFFNIAVNSLILCAFLFQSKRKSLIPLMIAHGIYDILSVYLLPAFLFYAGR